MKKKGWGKEFFWMRKARLSPWRWREIGWILKVLFEGRGGGEKHSGDCTTVATQPEATTLQQFIKKQCLFSKKKKQKQSMSPQLDFGYNDDYPVSSSGLVVLEF